MSSFFWPEPDLDFVSATTDPGDSGDRMYFVCHGNTILQMFDESGSWRPLGANELDVAGEQETHYMGSLGNVACYALDVKDAGGREFANLRANLGRIDSTLFNIAGRALQICDWYRTHRFCGQCGAATDSHRREHDNY